MRSIHTIFVCLVLFVAAPANGATTIVRCETADGKVTYSNGECPPGTRPVRKVEPSPPIVVHDRARTAGKIDRGSATFSAEPARAPRNVDPVQFDQELGAQLAEQRRECDTRARGLQRLQDDLESALPAARASAELALRRAQDDFRALCPRQR